MALSFHPLFIGGDPVNVTSMYILVSYLEKAFGVHYAMGGVQAIADAMGHVIEDQGGCIRLGEEIEEILCKQKVVRGVRTKSGDVITADIVVSNADPGHTYDRLLRGIEKRRWTPERLRRARWSMGLFVWYFGTKGTAGKWADVGHHTILNGPRYRDLLKDIFQKRHLADDMSIYLHRPSVTDPSVAPPVMIRFTPCRLCPIWWARIRWIGKRPARRIGRKWKMCCIASYCRALPMISQLLKFLPLKPFKAAISARMAQGFR